MISFKYKCFYIHIPKTGGNWMYKFLEYDYKNTRTRKEEGFTDVHKYATHHMVRWPREWEQYFKFTMIRNPWDRIVSAWANQFSSNDKKYAVDTDEKFNFTKKSFQNFIKNKLKKININHYWPQELWLIDAQYDFIAKFENRFEDMMYIQEKIKRDKPINFSLVAASNRRKNYREYYDEESKDIIMEHENYIIKKFKYEF